MQFQQFILKFPNLTTTLNFFTEDYEQVYFLDTESNIIEFERSVTATCGCCSDYEQFQDNLDYFIDSLSESDFNELMEELKSKHE